MSSNATAAVAASANSNDMASHVTSEAAEAVAAAAAAAEDSEPEVVFDASYVMTSKENASALAPTFHRVYTVEESNKKIRKWGGGPP